MPAPGLLACGLAKGCWVSGVVGKAGSHPRSKAGRRVAFPASGPEVFAQGGVRDEGINTALLSAACGHGEMWLFSEGVLTAA